MTILDTNVVPRRRKSALPKRPPPPPPPPPPYGGLPSGVSQPQPKPLPVLQRLREMSSEERQFVFKEAKETFPDDFREATRSPVALRKDMPVSPPFNFKKS